MDSHSLQVLEFHKVLERLAEHTSNSIGKAFAFQLEPLGYPETVLRRLQETREARLLRDNDSGLPLGGIRDIRDVIERARIETRLTPHELLDVVRTAAASRQMRQFLLNRSNKCPLLAEMASNLPILQILEQKIEGCISESAEVRDSASPELKRLRGQQKIQHSRLTDKLQGLLGSERTRTWIQEFVITVREGRYCIPVKAEYAKAFGGIVHDSSQSGATVFIEPAQTSDLGNELKQLNIKEDQEVERILRDLGKSVGQHYDEFQRLVSILGHLDVIHAKAVLAEEMGASEPKLNRRGIVKLYNARHPLLKGDIVPIDVEVGDKFTTLLITGPNTGGKTVTLKTVGLLCLMTLCGLQIPASPDSDVAIFDQVFSDIGDEQDIQQSLSTFSAHLKNIVRIVESIGSNALVLMDEVGAGTDPGEGAALAKALLDHLMARGARVIASTHYGELKEYAYSRAGVENASVEFNKETLSPTYHILLGIPGSSNALYIASRLGLPDDIVEEARSFLSHRELETGELLQQIEISRRVAIGAEKKALRDQAAAESARTEYETRVLQIADVQRTVRQQAQEEAKEILRRASDKAEHILNDLARMNKGARKSTSARKQLNTLRTETYSSLKSSAPPELEELAPMEPGHRFRKGDSVRVITLNMDGKILEEPKDGSAPVQMGSMRATLPLNQLRPLQKSEVRQSSVQSERKSQSQTTGASEIAMRKSMQIAPELMLRGMRVEEAQSLIDKYIDDAYSAGIAQARIIHGRGTGTLRKVVWEFLKDNPVVSSFRNGDDGEGGEGATVVTFRK